MCIEITEGGTYTASIESADVYYCFTGDRGAITVTVTSTDATLKVITFAIDGGMTEDTVEGNTFTVDDTEGSWIYFVITADSYMDCEFTVEFTEIQ